MTPVCADLRCPEQECPDAPCPCAEAVELLGVVPAGCTTCLCVGVEP